MVFTALFVTAVLGPILFVFVYLVYDGIQRHRRRQLYAPDLKRLPAFTGGLDVAKLRTDPVKARARLRGVVHVVNVIAGNSFVVDANGEVHDLQFGADADEVVDNAK